MSGSRSVTILDSVTRSLSLVLIGSALMGLAYTSEVMAGCRQDAAAPEKSALQANAPTAEPASDAGTPDAETQDDAKSQQDAQDQAIAVNEGGDAAKAEAGDDGETGSAEDTLAGPIHVGNNAVKVDFALQVAPIFASKCYRCHCETRAENDFRIDDIEMLAGFVAPKDLEGSSLWVDYLTTDDPDMRMPPENAHSPLSEAQLETVKNWILTSGEVVEVVDYQGLADQGADMEYAVDIPSTLWVLLGRMHPALTHFPVALFTVAAFFAVFGFSNEYWNKMAMYCLVLGTLGSVAAAAAGWGFAVYQDWGAWDADPIWSDKWMHRWGGIALTGLGVVVTMIAFYSRRNLEGSQFVWKLGTLLLAAMVGFVGHQGGEIHYGDIYGKPLERLQTQIEAQFNQPAPIPNDPAGAAPAGADGEANESDAGVPPKPAASNPIET